MKSKEAENNNLICIAEIIGVHGIKGMLKLKVFSDNPEDLTDYMPLYSFDGKTEFDFKKLQPHKNIYLTTLKNINSCNDAEALRGTKLYIKKDILPVIEEDNSYYIADLIGLTAKSPDDDNLGEVVNVVNFGAGDLLEIKYKNEQSYYIAFNNNSVPKVNLEKKEITIIKLEEI